MNLNKNYQTINGATDTVSDIDNLYNTAMSQIEEDMDTLETAGTNSENHIANTDIHQDKDDAVFNANKIQGKTIDITGIANTQILQYNQAQDKFLPTDLGTPAAHKTTHQDGGADEISIEGLSGTSAELFAHKNNDEVHIIPASASAPASLDLHEDTDNGTNKITIIAPSAVSSDKTLTLPDATGTIALLETVYPVGSVYTNKTNSTNPATLFGFGTWVAIAGRVVVGLDATQTEFDTAGETGGEKTHLLTASESGLPSHSHQQKITNGTPGTGGYYGTPPQTNPSVGGAGYNTDSNSSANASSAHNNLQPYVVCYVWERTA